MSGVILAVPDRPDSAAGVLAAAARLGKLTRSTRINVLAIRLPPITAILPTEDVVPPQVAQHIRNSERERAQALKRIYDAWSDDLAGAPEIATEWFDIEGMANRLVDEWGRRSDFIVMKRPAGHSVDPEQRAFHAALFDTGRPVLMVPPQLQTVRFGRRIAIAWRDDGRTIKAVLSILRCATDAEEIHVLAGARDAAAQPRLPDILDEHGIPASLHVLPITGQRAFGEVLLDTAHRLDADMLVMGAFARHPIRSLILGGVTRYMFDHADLPVLMRH
jgi:nucleotide-binding universal stress UspA family protein